MSKNKVYVFNRFTFEVEERSLPGDESVIPWYSSYQEALGEGIAYVQELLNQHRRDVVVYEELLRGLQKKAVGPGVYTSES